MVDARRRDIQAGASELGGNTTPRLVNTPDAAHCMGCTVWFVRTLIWGRQVHLSTPKDAAIINGKIAPLRQRRLQAGATLVA